MEEGLGWYLMANESAIYHRIEMAKGKIRMLEDQLSAYQRLLQEIKSDPKQLKSLVDKAMLMDGLNPLILVKLSPESSPAFDSWVLYGLSYITGKKYFPEKHGTRDYQRENNYMGFHFRN